MFIFIKTSSLHEGKLRAERIRNFGAHFFVCLVETLGTTRNLSGRTFFTGRHKKQNNFIITELFDFIETLATYAAQLHYQIVCLVAKILGSLAPKSCDLILLVA